jgi:Ca2+-binding RTX toxin-like protein
MDGGPGGPDTADYEAIFDCGEATFHNRDLDVSLSAGLARGVGRDRLISIHDVYGADGADTIEGNGENNYIFGAGGNDSMAGRAGPDGIDGEDGADSAAGGIGFDSCDAETETGCEV